MQLLAMRRRQLLEHRFAFGSQREVNPAAIGVVQFASDITPLRQAVGQPNSAMVQQLQTLSQFANEHAVASRKPFNRQQRLVLLRCDACRARRSLAEAQELPQRPAELRQQFIIRFRQIQFRCHSINVERGSRMGRSTFRLPPSVGLVNRLTCPLIRT